MFQGVTAPDVYLDHAATSPMRRAAIDALVDALPLVGNPSSLHRAGQRARRVLEEARERLAAAVGAHPSEVVFTSGGSEADSIALLGGVAARAFEGRTRCLVSAIEHPAVRGMVDRGGETIPVLADGVVDVSAGTSGLDEDVAICSVMAVNNETGVVQPLTALRDAAHEVGAWFHTDAVQALGHVPFHFSSDGHDLATLTAHKVGGPVGIGALLARREARPRPIGLGGGQEREIRSGTQMAALAASFAAAAEEAVAGLGAEGERLSALRDAVERVVVECGGRTNGGQAPRSPHIVNATFPGLRADDLLFLLDRAGIYASVGSACRAGVHQPSEVLLAMGRSEVEASASLRFSMGHSTGPRDVARLGEALPDAVGRAREALLRRS